MSNFRSNPNNDVRVPDSPTDGITSISWNPTAPNIFAATSWDGKVRCYEASQQVPTKGTKDSKSPILCSSWSADGSKLFTAGTDKKGMMWDIMADKFQQVAAHDAPIKEMFYVGDKNVLVTGSWDKTLRYWDLRSDRHVGSVNLSDRVYCMDVKGSLCVVGTAAKKLHVFTMEDPFRVYRDINSPLRQQLRCISCFPSREGFAVGSIEGRVAIHHQEERNSNKNFAFKCHRDGKDVFAVNAIDFHPQYGTFATAGSDGTFTFWDKDNRQRLKQFPRSCTSISACKFNANGNIFAYAESYDWAQGVDGFKQQQNLLLLRQVPDEDIKSKKKR